MFLITLVETIINVIYRYIQQLLEKIWSSTFLHDVTAAQLHHSLGKVKGKRKFLLNSKWKNYFHRLYISNCFELINVATKKNNCGRVLFQSTFTTFRNDHFLEIDFIAVAKTCWNLLIFSAYLFWKSMHLWAHFRNTINQLHVNGTWSILAVISLPISFMAVISWIANVKHQTCKSESVRTWRVSNS